MVFTFYPVGQIIFGRGESERLGELAAGFGRKVLVVRGGDWLDPVVARIEADLGSRGVGMAAFRVKGEPQLSTVDDALAVARDAGCDVVIGLGGGSALDTAKAVAGLLSNGGVALDYMEVIGRGLPIEKPAAPLIAVPTTSGTGTEVTRNAVLADKSQAFKASMRSPHLIPRVALVDPALTDSQPAHVTASTGLDALTQVIEPYVSNKRQPMTDGMALTGIRLAAGALRRVFDDPNDASARDDMALVALMSGVCLANAGLGAVHGFAGPLGATFPIPHGVVCAALLPHVMAANVEALHGEDPQHEVLLRYAHIGDALTGQRLSLDSATVPDAIESGIAFVRDLVQDLGIPKLSSYGMNSADIPDLVARSRRTSSMRYNPLVLPDAVLGAIVERAL